MTGRERDKVQEFNLSTPFDLSSKIIFQSQEHKNNLSSNKKRRVKYLFFMLAKNLSDFFKD